MDYITLTPENLEQEHICCAIAGNGDCQVAAKKAWLADRIAEGLVFRKADERGKCFIEYLPAEAAFAPIDAPGWMYIDCLWVSGRLKGHGYADELLDSCIRDSREQGKAGIVVLSSAKKKPFLSDPAYLRHWGFVTADTAPRDYALLCLPFDPAAPLPRFRPQVKTLHTDEPGWVLYYTAQCPYTAKYVPVAQQIAAAHGITLRTVCLDTAAAAKEAPAPFTAYALFRDGEFLTHEIQSEKMLEKLFGAAAGEED